MFYLLTRSLNWFWCRGLYRAPLLLYSYIPICVQFKAACDFSIINMDHACFLLSFDSYNLLRVLFMVCAHMAYLPSNQFMAVKKIIYFPSQFQQALEQALLSFGKWNDVSSEFKPILSTSFVSPVPLLFLCQGSNFKFHLEIWSESSVNVKSCFCCLTLGL